MDWYGIPNCNLISLPNNKTSKLQTTNPVYDLKIYDNGSYGLLTTQNGCLIASLSDNWEYEYIFHESIDPPRFAFVIPTKDPLQILSVYLTYAARFEIVNSDSLFTTRLLKTYSNDNFNIICGIFYCEKSILADVLDTCFITADSSGRIIVKRYEEDSPVGITDSNVVLSQCDNRSIGYQTHSILKLAFDKTNRKDIFAFLTQDIFCVFSTNDYFKPLNYILLQDCPQAQNALSRRNSPRYFRSFAFCGGGNVLLLTDSEIYRWNYQQNSACSLLYTCEHKGSFRCIRWKAEGNIIGSRFESRRVNSRGPVDRRAFVIRADPARWRHHTAANAYRDARPFEINSSLESANVRLLCGLFEAEIRNL